MTAAWPSDVPTEPLVTSYAESPDDNVAVFQPEVGPPKTRRRMSMSTDTLSLEMWMTFDQYASLLTFYRSTLKDGTLPFTFTHPRTGVTTTFMFVAGDGRPRMKLVDFETASVSFAMRSLPT